ncbi:MAG: carbon starvation protein A [Phycisphaeraceae bacterium]|nr:carbon starvation protein A [Phycisphaeraceae bacterium]MCB9848025.1 carbon starvation protein A [Phycisphaeraceae bacterium]
MDALLLTLGAGVVFVVAYFTYGRWLSRKVFCLDPDAVTPAHELRDDVDYCPTRKSIVFGHHFTSIAGTGPIVGPAIAVMWGWLPAILWVVIGSVFMGAVHDFSSLVVSMRNRGRSVGDIAGDLLGPRVRVIFLVILVVALWVVLAIFGLVIAAVLRQYPAAIFPVLAQIPLAVVIGVTVHRKGGNILIPSAIALVLMYVSVIYGDWGPLHAFNRFLAAQPTILWVAGLLVYAYVASVLPVWTLLQPRDYINALQLVASLGLLVVGLIVAAAIGGAPDLVDVVAESDTASRPALSIVAPMFNPAPEGAPPMIPILFITIACGAISGFHCLVSSGTTSKQIGRETDAQAVGYGSMLTEGFLATLVIVSCVAGLGLGISRSADSSESHWGGLFGAGTYLPGTNPKDDVYIHVFHDPYNSDGSVSNGHSIQTRIKIYSGESVEQFTYELAELDSPERDVDGSWIDLGNGRIRIVPAELGRYQLTGQYAFNKQYESWSAAGSLGAKVGAFVDGAANLVKSMGIPAGVAVALMGVLVASFAGTTMDTACRLQRYVIQELSRSFLSRRARLGCTMCGYDLTGLPHLDDCPECGHGNAWRDDPGARIDEAAASARIASVWNPFRWLATPHGATVFAVVTALALAAIPARGQSWSLTNAGAGGLLLWPLFGATNQLLGGLAFCVIGAWLIATRRPWWFMALPAVVMLVMPAWAMGWQAFLGDADTPSWVSRGDWLLVSVASVILILEAWLVAEVLLRMRHGIARVEVGAPAATASDSDPTSCPPC